MPNSSRDQVVGWLGEALKVRVASPPEGGRANRRIAMLLAEALGLPEGAVRVVSGHASPRKIVEIAGSSMQALRAVVGE